MMNPNITGNLLGTIESVKGSSSYTDAQLHILSKEFSAAAKRLQLEYDKLSNNTYIIKTEYSIYDFYPKEKLEDILVEKKIDIFIKDLYPTGALYSILEETNFLDKPRTVNHITTYINNYFNKNWIAKDLNLPLDRAAAKGDLIKTDPPAKVTYQKPPKKLDS